MDVLGLRRLIGLTITGLIAAITLLRGVQVGYEAEDHLRDAIGASLLNVADGMVEKINSDMRSRANQVLVLTTLDALLTPEVAQRVVDEIATRDRTAAWVGITDAAGTVVAGSGGVLVGRSIAHRPVFLRAQDGLFVGDVHDALMLAAMLANPTGEAMKFVDVAAPLKTRDGRLLGVLAVHYSWSWVRTVVGIMLSPFDRADRIEVFVVATDGTILLGPKGTIGQPLALESLTAAWVGERGWRIEDWPDGRSYLTGYSGGVAGRVFDELGWTVLVRQPSEVAFAPAYEMRSNVVGSGLVVAVLFGLIGWVAAGPIARPLQAIARAAERIRLREEGAVIPDVGGTTEVRTLSRVLRELVSGLTASNAALVETNDALARMRDIANLDRLTDLPNRRFFEHYLEVAKARAQADHMAVVVMYVDLDGFKPVNDRFGHNVGDEVLRQTARRLSACVRSGDVIARLGGDEFVAVLLVSERAHGEVSDIPQRLIAAVNAPYPIQGLAITVGCSVGVARWPEDDTDLQTVLKRADEALYEAKRQGKNRVVEYADMRAAETEAA